MNRIEYEIKKSDAVSSALEIAKSGVCPALARVSFYEKEKSFAVSFEPDGLSSFKAILKSRGFIDFSLLLTYLRSIAEAAKGLSDYLIDSELISFSLDKLFFDKEKRAVFLIDESDGSYMDKTLLLLEEIQTSFPACNAGLIAEKIRDKNSGELFGFGSILSMLSAWQMELR